MTQHFKKHPKTALGVLNELMATGDIGAAFHALECMENVKNLRFIYLNDDESGAG